MTLEKELRMAIQTGKVAIGSRKTLKDIKNGSGKLIIFARNCPIRLKKSIDQYSKISKIPVYVYSGTSIELGNLCKKPFPVAAMSIRNAGNSDVLSIIKVEKGDGKTGHK